MKNWTIFLTAIVINLVVVYLFTIFVAKPLHDAARGMAILMCQSLNQECKF